MIKPKIMVWPFSKMKSFIAIALCVALISRLFVLQVKSWPVTTTLEGMISLDYVTVKTKETCKNPEAGTDFKKNITQESSSVAWLVSPGYWALGTIACRSGEVKVSQLVKWNQWFTMGTAFMGALTLRLLTRSWLLGMLAAFSILTRASILSRQGLIGVDAPVMFFIMSWFCGFSHYVRTGSIFAFGLGALSYMGAVFFDRATIVLGFAIPILLTVAWLFRNQLAKSIKVRMNLDEEYLKLKNSTQKIFSKRSLLSNWVDGLLPKETVDLDPLARMKSGGILTTIRVPFAYWAYHRMRWLRITVAWLLFALLLTFVIVHVEWQFLGVPRERLRIDLIEPLMSSLRFLKDDFWVVWLVQVLEPLDFRLLCALSILILCALQSPVEALTGYLEISLLFFISIILLFCSAWFSDRLDAAIFNALGSHPAWGIMRYHVPVRRCIGWVEPTLVTLGVGGIYNLIVIANKRTHRGRTK